MGFNSYSWFGSIAFHCCFYFLFGNNFKFTENLQTMKVVQRIPLFHPDSPKCCTSFALAFKFSLSFILMFSAPDPSEDATHHGPGIHLRQCMFSYFSLSFNWSKIINLTKFFTGKILQSIIHTTVLSSE